MKARLSSTLWFLVLWAGVALFGVLALAYHAGKESGGVALLDASALTGAASGALLGALALALIAALSLAFVLSKRVIKPVGELAKFSERLAAGDNRARTELASNDEFGLIVENFNRTAAKVAHAATNQEAQDSLQRSITELLTVINQVARGDLTLRGKVTNDALGNVADSVNYMLDNFTKVLERVRKAAMEVTACSNNILVAADEMQAGATQQDQEITNTSRAVEELTVSMKQVSNNAEASAEAARRALDAAEQGNRAVRDTLEGMQRIRASVQATAKKIKSLGDRSLEISEIINVINDITEQTNLLALNAAIEAARAGEAGPRFRGRRRRSSQAGRTLPQRHERHRGAHQGHSGRDKRSGRRHGRRHRRKWKWGATSRRSSRDALSTRFRASFASPPNSSRKFRSLRNSRCAARKASRTPCRSFPASRARPRRDARQTGRDRRKHGETFRSAERSAGAVPFAICSSRLNPLRLRTRPAPPCQWGRIADGTFRPPVPLQPELNAEHEISPSHDCQAHRARTRSDSHADRGALGNFARFLARAIFLHSPA